MKLSKIRDILEAEVVFGEELLDMTIKSACGADLMSDVLAFTKENALLLTGMINLQVIRTAEISDLSAVVFVRGKMPREDIIAGAKEANIPLLMTKFPMYEACGRLYSHGLSGCARKAEACHE